MKHMSFVQTAEFDWLPWLVAMATERLNYQKYSKIISSEVIRGMKLKFCRNVHNIRIYKNLFLIAVTHVLSLLWHLLKVSIDLQWEKVKVGLYCYLIADILTKVLQKCSLNSPLPNIWILSKPLKLIGCHDNRKYKFSKKYSKIISSEVIRGIKLKLFRIFITLASTKIMFFIAVAHVLSLLWQLKVSIDL